MSTNRHLFLLTVLVGINLVVQSLTLYTEHARRGNAQPGNETTGRALQPPKAKAIGAVVELRRLPTQGSSAAHVGVIEFSDYQCPFCNRYAKTILPPLRKAFVETGKIRYAFSNLPLPIHSNAKLLASAAICAGQQDQYWSMHDQLFANAPSARKGLSAIAQSLGLNLGTFDNCLESPVVEKQLADDLAQAQTIGLNGTPTFIIGPIDATDRLTVQKVILGVQPFEDFARAITEEIGKANPIG